MQRRLISAAIAAGFVLGTSQAGAQALTDLAPDTRLP
jgi:hypothetical protein